ncbi:MFS transporter [Falsiroseomonas tokyonensis]|uniref:MFS transporter n=1 Tax=Falsiroseomonas tokyonensis TaxID=430521 RepID=A0ABV7BSX5_9PROT|nr:MFS transporter [Falsiroseomonas tokyonensis]
MPLLATVAFANALGAVIFFPLGPFLARDLGIPVEDAALTTTFYTLAAGLGGLVGALLLGGVSRRAALLGSLCGLGVFSLATFLAPNFPLLLAARACAGACAGPLMAAVVTSIAESVPEERRNRAVSSVTGAYGLALVAGLPLALVLGATAGGWRVPILAISGLYLLLLWPVWWLLGPRPGQPPPAPRPRVTLSGLARLLGRGESLTGLALIGAASFATLLVSPHIAAYALGNAGLGEPALRVIYLVGGALAVLTTRATGTLMDRVGVLPASLTVGCVLTTVLVAAFALSGPAWLVTGLLGTVLAVQLARSTVAQGSATRVALPAERMSYQCLVAATTSFGQGLGAAASTLVVRERPDGGLDHMGWLVGASIALAWLAPLLVVLLHRQLERRGAE